MPKRLYLATVVIVILILFNGFFIFKTANHDNENSSLHQQDTANSPAGRTGQLLGTNNTQAFILPASEASYMPILNTNVAAPEVKGISALVYDVKSSRYLYAKNIHQKVPIASLTKLLTGIVVLDKLNPNEIVTVGSESIKVDGQKQDLFLGEKITVEDLTKMMLIASSNDAAYALAGHAQLKGISLVDEMNSKALDFGMVNSHFKDPAGLDDEAYSDAEDIVKLANRVISYLQILNIISQATLTFRSLDGIEHNIESTNKLIDQVPLVVGGKTGYTEGASGCMVLIVQVSSEGDKIISVVLGSSERFTDTTKLIDWSKLAYTWK